MRCYNVLFHAKSAIQYIFIITQLIGIHNIVHEPHPHKRLLHLSLIPSINPHPTKTNPQNKHKAIHLNRPITNIQLHNPELQAVNEIVHFILVVEPKVAT